MSRRNLCPNPSAKNNATGWSGSGTPARATDFPTPAVPRATGVRATTGGFIQCPAAACAPGDVFNLSFYQHNGSAAFQFGRTAYVGYTRSSGGDVFPETWNTGSLGDIGSTLRTNFTTAAAPALATGVYFLWDSLAVGLGISSALLEKVGTVDTYADGDTASWVWDGADGNSTSSEVTTTPVGRTLSAPWNIRGAVAQALSMPWAVRGSVGRSLDARWAQRGSVGRTLDTPWNIRGVTGRTLDLPWALRGQISRTLGVSWTVRAKVTSNMQLLWVVNGAPPSTTQRPSIGVATLTAQLTAYPESEVTAYL